ncbi:exonuclease subunit SbcD [Sphingobacterium daejeonense]|uniref:metallophosphoesterase family protein n=1 Tax=Sphingobacterium daejeonense TaxID=371142 RepID=UPI0021A2A38D|nr:exonuclease subunit SbcD [Sphingobacterium daejeonense]MCT1529878.1 exonuclease subunit SbcD [Sphingobacterium daejeonense]
MRILHTADWHLGKKLDFYSRMEEQKEVMEEICQIADREDVDLVVVSGDLYDTFNPPVEATELLYRTLKKLSKNGKRPVVAIAGNHDSPDRIDSPDSLARELGIFFFGQPHLKINPITVEGHFDVLRVDEGFLEIKIPKYYYPIRILSTAFANEIRLKQFLGFEDKATELQEVLKQKWQGLAGQYCDIYGVNLLATHLYMLKRGGEVLEEPEGEKPIRLGFADLVYSDSIPSQIQYTALGHLHRFHEIGQGTAPVIYPGSPLAYSFSESGQKKQVVIVDLEPNKIAQYRNVQLEKGRPLVRTRFRDIDEAVRWLHDNKNALVELTIESDNFLTASDLKRIHEAHDGIIHIIPVVSKKQEFLSSGSTVNLDQDMKDLFKDYFKSKYGQEPNEELLTLFDEVATNTLEKED